MGRAARGKEGTLYETLPILAAGGRAAAGLPLAAADVSGWEITVIGLLAVFVALAGLATVFHLFNVWDERREERARRASVRSLAPPPTGALAAAAPGAGEPGGGDSAAREQEAHEARVCAAIALAIALATAGSAAAVAYRIDGVPDGGGMSAWRATMGPGASRLATTGGDRR